MKTDTDTIRRREWRYRGFAGNLRRPLASAGVVLSLAGFLGCGLGARFAQADAVSDSLRILEIWELRERGNYEEAEVVARAWLAEAEARAIPDTLEISLAIDLLCETLWQSGQLVSGEARRLAERALAMRERRLGPNSLGVANSLNTLAIIMCESGEVLQARPVFERTLRVRRERLGDSDLEVASTLGNLGRLALLSGDANEARRYHEAELEILRGSGGERADGYTTCLTNLGNSLAELGEYSSALTLYETALELDAAALSPEDPAVSGGFANLGNLHFHLGNYDQATSYYERALHGWERVFSERHGLVAVALDNLASTSSQRGDHKTAESLATRAVNVAAEAYGVNHPEVARMISNLAVIKLAQGDVEGARLAATQSLESSRSTFGQDTPHSLTALRILGSASSLAGDNANAIQILQKAAAVQGQALGGDHPATGIVLAELSRAHARNGDWLSATRSALDAERIGRAHLQLTTRSLSESQALRYAAVRVSGLDVALTSASRGLPDSIARAVWDSQIRSRATILDAMAERRRWAHASTDSMVDSLRSAVQTTRQRLANLSLRSLSDMEPEMYKSLIDETVREKEHAERALAEASAPFAEQLARDRVGFEDVLAALPAGSGLVAYSRYMGLTDGAASGGSPKYLAFVLGASRTVEVVSLGMAADVDSLIADWRNAVSSPFGEDAGLSYRRAGADLRGRVWDPLASQLERLEQVFVIPDGDLHLVSLATLPVGDDGFLVEREPMIHYLSAERDLVNMNSAHPGSGLLAVGDPNYDEAGSGGSLPSLLASVGLYRGAHSGCVEFKAVRFPRLPGTAKEVREVERLWKRQRSATDRDAVTSFKGSRADEGRIKTESPGKRVIHFATHGFFLGEACPSALEGTHRGVGGTAAVDADRPPPVPSGENPLVLSGLALAGANRRSEAKSDEDDGILTAEEIASLDLSGVEWAVLSACGTGSGEIHSGEGVFGLRRAFEIAGAGTLILSLWSVEDKAAAEWMRALYSARFQEGRTTVAAVREASLSILSDRRLQGLSTHPFYWGAFIAAGDWN